MALWNGWILRRDLKVGKMGAQSSCSENVFQVRSKHTNPIPILVHVVSSPQVISFCLLSPLYIIIRFETT